MEIFRYLRKQRKLQSQIVPFEAMEGDPPKESPQLSNNLAENLDYLKQNIPNSPDLMFRTLRLGEDRQEEAVLVYNDGMVDKNSLNNNVIRPLIETGSLDILQCVSIANIKLSSSWDEIEDRLYRGFTLLIVDRSSMAYLFETQGWPQRAIEEPQSETSINGAHQGFSEIATQNIALIRRHLPNKQLQMSKVNVGIRGKTEISVLYLADVCHPSFIHEFLERIRRIEIDSIINTGELAECIEDHPYSPLPQFQLTERPDNVASHLLQGRIAAVVDCSPNVLISPMTFFSYFQTLDDYSSRWYVSSFIRLLRFIGFLISILLPALYISALSFHYELIPLEMIITIGESRYKVAFPPLLEALMMELALEMIREAGIRLPAPIGQTVGIVGGIVIGQAAVEAGIVSNIMVIVVSLTAIASFIIPSKEMGAAIRLIQFPMMLMAAMFGMIGISIGIMSLIGYMVSMKSLGTPYMTPLAPFRLWDWRDLLIRLPIWRMDFRPQSNKPMQKRRQGNIRHKEDN
ncbi:spore germination protein [Paenibacillus sp. PL2-23]|uniref:spore germination protein n=1 Tax=Paenibacillus sp. PL2-23 TaxID=2100729 RepID=UPI0030FA3CB6